MPTAILPDPEKTALAALKQAEEEAEVAKQEVKDKRQELKTAKASEKAAAAQLTEAKVRVKTRWVLLVGEAVLNAADRELSDSKGKKQEWFNQLNPVLVTDIKPDDRVLYDGWKKQMQELGATEDDTKSDNGANAGSDSKDSPKPVVGWQPKSLGNSEWGAQLTGKSVAELPQDLTGVPIIVTTSKGKSWESRITDVVSRDEKTVIVRTAEKPKLPDDGPPTA